MKDIVAMQHTKLYSLIFCILIQGSMVAMDAPFFYPEEDDLEGEVNQPSSFRARSQEPNSLGKPFNLGFNQAVKEAKEALSDFEEAFLFLQQHLKDAKKEAHNFGKRLWAKPFTECLRFYARIFHAMSLIAGISGITAGVAVVFYIGPSFAYKFISYTWQFAQIIRDLMGHNDLVGEQCLAQLANGHYVLVACNQLKNMGIDAAKVAMNPEAMQQAFKQATAHQGSAPWHIELLRWLF